MAKTVKPAAKKAMVKKATPKKTVPPKDEIRTIKYADKSPGQPQLPPIFDALRQILLQNVKGALMVTNDKPGQFELYSKKPVEAGGNKPENIYFAGLLVQKGYVGLYLMPVYSDALVKKAIAPELLKCLTGKSCFHIKKLDDALKVQIQDALRVGYDCYKAKRWV